MGEPSGRRRGLVSIITPSLNAEAFIAETIESVLAQTYGAIEYLLVDGGSTDRTLEIARSYGERVRIYELPGSSQSRAVNEGFSLSTGEFFTFLNADDTLESGAIGSAADTLQRYPSAAYAYANAMHVDPSGRSIALYPTREFSLEALQFECFICQPATLVRALAFAAVDGLDESWDSVLDYDLWIRLARANLRPVYIDEVWANARMHGASKTIRERRRMFEEVCRMLRQHYGYVPFTWIHAYAGYLVDQKDQFFEASVGSPRRSLLTLTLGLSENRHEVRRFLLECIRETVRLWIQKRRS